MKKKTLRPIHASKRIQRRYENSLNSLVKLMHKDVRRIIIPVVKGIDKQANAAFTQDSIAGDLQKAFTELRGHYTGIGILARKISRQFLESSNKQHKQRFYKAVNQAIGVETNKLVRQDVDLDEFLKLEIKNNVSLIKTIPSDYFDDIEQIIYREVVNKQSDVSLIDQLTPHLEKLGNDVEWKARRIARDQTSKINAKLNQFRQEKMGIEEYKWRTVGDGDRVRPTHRSKHNKTFRWDSPPPDTGHPGHDIQCRCTALAIINIETL